MTESPPSNVHEYSVSELAGALKHTVEDAYGHVRVRGELGRVVRARSGHVYMDLKDERAVISTIIWKGVAGRLRFAPEEGLEVVAEGRLSTYPGRSQYQLIIESLEPAGAGALMALLEQRRQMFQDEGLFDAARKQKLPFLPEVIGVITSPTGAVIRDILHRLRDRFARPVLLWPVLVQGETCAEEVAAAIDGFNTLPPGGAVPRPDVLIVARGGGAIEDLWGFNEEVVVRAAGRSHIPLISAVGHETDWTLLDHVADARAPTPTGAAEIAVPVRAELLTRLRRLEGRLASAVTRLVTHKATDLRAAARGLPRPEDVLGLMIQRLDYAGARLGRALQGAMVAHGESLAGLVARLRPQALIRDLHRRGQDVEALGLRLHQAHGRFLARAKTSLETTVKRLALQNPRQALMQRQDDMRALWRRATEGVRRIQHERRQQITSAGSLLRSLSYQGVLARGFAVVRHADGTIATRACALKTGEQVRLEFTDGARPARIDPGPRKASRQSGGSDGDQGSLF